MIKGDMAMMETAVKNKMKEYAGIITDVMRGSIFDLSVVLCEKDKHTFEHCQRVLDYSFMIGFEAGLGKKDMGILGMAAYFHDVGKIGIPNKILKKRGTLTDEELTMIRIHPRLSAGLFRAAGGSREAVKTLACHHERYDGQGYPYSLQGENIPLLSRIIAVADAYDAMTTTRSYSTALKKEEAIRRMVDGKGTQFDPSIVDIFLGKIETPQVYLLGVV